MPNNFNTNMISYEIYYNDSDRQHLLSLAAEAQDLEDLVADIRNYYFDRCKLALPGFVQAMLDNALDNVDWFHITKTIIS